MSVFTYKKNISKPKLNIPIYSDKKTPLMAISTTIVGPSFSGKTQLLFSLMKNVIANNSGLVPTIYIFTPSVTQYEFLKNKYKNVYITDEITVANLNSIYNHIKTKKSKRDWSNKVQNILILDDISGLLRDKKLERVIDLLYTTLRHYRCNLYLLAHSMSQISPTQRNNTQIWCLFRSNIEGLKMLFDTIQLSIDFKEFINLFNIAIEKKTDMIEGYKVNSKSHNFMMVNVITGQILRNTYMILFG
jgi:hypothetical protein